MINIHSFPGQQYWTALQGEKRTPPRAAALLPSHIGWGEFSDLFDMCIWWKPFVQRFLKFAKKKGEERQDGWH